MANGGHQLHTEWYPEVENTPDLPMIGGLVERPNPTLSEHVEWYSVWSQLVTFLFYPPFTLKLGTDNPGSARIIRCAFDFAVEYSIRGQKAIFSQKFPFFRFSFLSVY